ncbi:hypothetical protein LCGC14_0363540 [marine sediment metagenome]|uniref:Uncharacterized protein n=1 Tax=marine sediment metagenome TaxID=412755 RepID=A0A0F9TQC2_9ZZZZ
MGYNGPIRCVKCGVSKKLNKVNLEVGIANHGSENKFRNKYLCRYCKPYLTKLKGYILRCIKCGVSKKVNSLQIRVGISRFGCYDKYKKRYKCQKCSRVKIEDLIKWLRLIKDKNLSKTEFRESGKRYGYGSRSIIKYVLDRNNLTLDELAKQAGIEFTIPDKGLGLNETMMLDRQEQKIGRRIERQKYVIGYRLDGYDSVANTAYEVDEYHHQYQKIEDQMREDKIKAAIKCKFVRIPDTSLEQTTLD